jgi:hypothetical protein
MLLAGSVSDLKFVYSIANNKQFDLGRLDLDRLLQQNIRESNAISYQTF